MAQPVYLIDASIYIFRAYFAIPDNWHSPEGRPVNAIYGYSRFLLKFLQQVRPKQVAAAFDESLGSCFRNEIYAGYKADRRLPDEALAYQLTACKELTERLGIRAFASDRYEADDIIATLARISRARGSSIAVLSRDKDLGQLIRGEGDYLWDFSTDKTIYQSGFIEHFGVQPSQLVDLLALTGDRIDSIPGVPGIGKKTAAGLLRHFGDIRGLYSDLSAVANCPLRGAGSIAGKLAEYQQQVYMAQQLALLETGVPLACDGSLDWQPSAIDEVLHFLNKFSLAGAVRQSLAGCYSGNI